MPVVKLTQQLINNELRCPDGKARLELVDDYAPARGLYVLVSAASPGQGTYFLRYKDANGKTCHQKIARTTDIDLAEARNRAKRLKSEIVLGADPRGEARAQKEVPTMSALFELYAEYAAPRKRSFARDEELYRLRIRDKFGGRRLNQISRQQIQTFHTELLQTGLAPATCDHHLKLLKRMFNLAIDWGIHTGANPVARVPLFNPANGVERYLNDEELQRLVTVLRTDSNRPVCSIALYLLATGARLNEALSARWVDVDRANRTWTVPAKSSKSGKVRHIPLNDSALHVLSVIGTQGKHAHVFVNEATRNPFTTIAKVWTRLRNAAELPGLRLHDLRHGYASLLIQSGRTLYEVQKILGHSSPSVTQRYAHLDRRTLQNAANAASEKIEAAAQKTKAA